MRLRDGTQMPKEKSGRPRVHLFMWLCLAWMVLMTLTSPLARANTEWGINDSCDTAGGTYWFPSGPMANWGVDRTDTGAYPNNAHGGPADCHLDLSPQTCDTCGINNSASYYLPVNDNNYSGNYNLESWVGCHVQHWNNGDDRWWRYPDSTLDGVAENYHFDQSRNLCPGEFSISTSAYFDGHAGYMREIDKSSMSDKVSFDFLRYAPT
jgi:hypothetical protein